MIGVYEGPCQVDSHHFSTDRFFSFLFFFSLSLSLPLCVLLSLDALSADDLRD